MYLKILYSKKTTYTLTIITKIGTAQNFVPNPSFEVYNNCPSMLANLSVCAAWQNFGETPDYFNTCGLHCLKVPDVCLVIKFQKAEVHTLDFLLWYPFTNYREYLGIPLNSTLVIGINIYFNFYVSNGGKSGAMLGTNKIGARSGALSYTQSNPPLLTNWAHIYTDSIITNTLN